MVAASIVHLMSKRDVHQVRAELDQAYERQRLPDEARLLHELEALDVKEPRWSHRLGDVLVRQKSPHEAVAAYTRAVDKYVAQGFIPRAVAMAKTILTVDPSAKHVLARVDSSVAKVVRESVRPRPSAAARASSLRLEPDPLPKNLGRISADDVAASSLQTPENKYHSIVPLPLDLATAPSLHRLRDSADEVYVDEPGDDLIDLELTEIEIVGTNISASGRPSAEQLALLPAFPLFADVPKEVLLTIAGGSLLVDLTEGELLLRAGDAADALFVIVEGTARVAIPGVPAERCPRVGEGDVAGETCFFEGAIRRLDLVVEGRLLALKLSRELLSSIVTQHPPMGDVLVRLLARRLIANLMQSSPLFDGLARDARYAVAKLFEVRRAASGLRLVEAGKMPDGLYLGLTGGLILVEGAKQRLCEPGVVIGQTALFQQRPADFSAIVPYEMLVLRLPADRIGQLGSDHPSMRTRLTAG